MELLKKVSIILVLIMLFNFCVPNAVQAKDDDGVGGKLLEPVISLVVSIGDACMNIAHKTLISQQDTLISADMVDGALRVILTVIVGIVVAVAVIIATIYTCGAAAAVLGPLLASFGITIGTVSAGAVLSLGLIAGRCRCSIFL